jgi:hypothetical protein
MVVSAVLIAAAPAPTWAAEPTGELSGVVTDEAGTAVAGATVTVSGEGSDGKWINRDTLAGPDGAWRMDALYGGNYGVTFTPPGGSGLAAQKWREVSVHHRGFKITLAEHGTVSGIDPQLPEAGSITGSVMDSQGAPLAARANLYVRADGSWEHVEQVTTTGDGAYAFSGLHPGDYAVRFDGSVRDRYIGEWWDGATGSPDQVLIPVEPGEALADVDARLTATVTLSGTLTPPPGVKLDRPSVAVYELLDDQWNLVDYATSFSGGGFRLTGLPPGTYTVRAEAYIPHEGHVWWGGSDDTGRPEPIVIAEGDTRADIDIQFLPLVPSTEPVIQGRTTVGEILSVDATGWPAQTTLQYQWSRRNKPVPGATASTYALTAEDLYEEMRVTVIARHPDYTTVEHSVGRWPYVLPGRLVSTKPVIRGNTWVGATLTADIGTWSPGAQLEYRWYTGIHSGSRELFLGLGPTLVVPQEARGSRIYVEVEGSARGYEGYDYYEADPTDPVTAPPIASATPAVTGTAAVGRTVTAATGSWTPGASFTYEWAADGEPIAGATESTLSIGPSLARRTLTVTVRGEARGLLGVTRTSPGVVVATGTLTIGSPKVTGTLKVGGALTASPGQWTTGTRFAYQWYASGMAIRGATGSSYVPTSSVVGKSLSVRVTGTRTGYATAAKTSPATLKLLGHATPTVTGTAKVGRIVTASPGRWTSGTTFRYQWYANGIAVKKATSSKLRLTSSLAGKRLVVKVTGMRSGFASVTASSTRTVVR